MSNYSIEIQAPNKPFQSGNTESMVTPTDTDGTKHLFPVSINGVLREDNKVLLALNEREEWELPGGKLERGEKVEEGLVHEFKEFKEETGLDMTIGAALPPYLHDISSNAAVLIVPFMVICDHLSNFCVSKEHSDLNLISISDLENINVPRGYLTSILHGLEP